MGTHNFTAFLVIFSLSFPLSEDLPVELWSWGVIMIHLNYKSSYRKRLQIQIQIKFTDFFRDSDFDTYCSYMYTYVNI